MAAVASAQGIFSDDGVIFISIDDKSDYYLHYQPDLAFLSSDAAILTQDHAERIRDASRQNGKKAIVYAAGNYIGQRELWASHFATGPTHYISPLGQRRTQQTGQWAFVWESHGLPGNPTAKVLCPTITV